jgi:hypothetical protein
MSNSEDRPDVQRFMCDGCKFEFWSVSPTYAYDKPSRIIDDKLESLQTQTQCSLCKKLNTLYWYMGVSPS